MSSSMARAQDASRRARFNLLALNRKEPLLMRTMVADPGYTFVSVDLSAGEPTVTAHFSKDPNYYDATFGMVNKAPYWKDGVLKIDDLYLSVMSVSPIGRERLQQVFQEGINGVQFVEQWQMDAEVVKAYLKKERQIHKILALGLAYGLSSPKSMVEHALKAGYTLTPKEAKAFHDAYWQLFSGVKRLSDRLIVKWRKEGHIVNAFGYRSLPDADYKVLNAFIQSSVSGLMNMLCMKFFAAAPFCKFVGIVHDEVLFQCPDDRLVEARKIMDAAVESVNQELNWSVKVRTGWAPGKNLYEAK